MFNNNKILVVIPARRGSKGIPRKNIRLLHNKPLISYAISTARSSQYVDDVVLTTDDSEIALIAEKFGASVVRRSHELATDDVPLDPVIYNAMIQKEKLAFDEYDIVIEKISFSENSMTKNMVIRVTDEELIALTGGIVQGMSGSPIIQDGKLVGAVTHVFVNEPTKGYGIFIENMLEFEG